MDTTIRKTVLKDVRFLGVPDMAADVEELRPERGAAPADPESEARRAAAAREIGRTLARLRTSAGLDVAALAERAGVPADRLALVETGEALPGLRMLWSLAGALSVPFGSLLDGALHSEASDGEFRVRRATEGHMIGSATGLRSRVLTAEGIAGAPEVYEIEIRGGAAEAAEAHGRATCEHIVVMAGTLIVQVGEKEARLEAGDSLFFRADRPHRYLNPETTDARALLLMVYA